jgi:molybdate transport system regulatory protein
MPRLRIRIDFDPSGPDRQLGPGKIGLLEHVAETGSISAGGRAMGMSYRRAWLLIDSLNRCFREKVIETRHGGTQGGGAVLTPFGQMLIEEFRAIEQEAAAIVARRLAALEAATTEPDDSDAARPAAAVAGDV